MNDGIYTTTPPFAGLPPLVENGKCRVMGNYVIYFIPFYIPFDGEYLYKKIRLFRFNPSKQVFKLVFSYRYEGFHITTAAATNGYLVCSRLPYDAEVLKLMTTAKKLAKENQFIKQSRSKLQKEVSSLKKKNRSLTVSNLAQRTQISNQNEHIRNLNTQIASNRNKRERPNRNDSGYVASLQNRVLKNIRDRDPVDIFVYHPEQKVMVHVLEYHKPADHVHLDGNILTLYDKPSGRSHIFELTMKTSTVSDYDLSEPLRPSSLCDAF
jgi:FtsZ-binding cell division protein ZapB